MQPADVFFVAAQDEFARAAPQLSVGDEAELRHVRLTPEAAFQAAGEAFLNAASAGATAETGSGEAASSGATPAGASSRLGPRVDAVVRALLALQCLDRHHAPLRFAQAADHLSGILQALARLANNSGHLPLAFAASSGAMWCAMHLADHLSQRWDEAQALELVKELDAQASEPSRTGHVGTEQQGLAQGQLQRRTRLLVQHGAAARRAIRSWTEHPDHRRRFIRFMANRGAEAASEADLRLLLLTRDATPAELAAHIRRLSGLVDENVVLVPSRHKRPRLAETNGT